MFITKRILVVFLLTFSICTGEIIQLGPNLFAAGIPSNQITFYEAKYSKQWQSNWCWAATIQMVLNYHGLHVTQDQIVRKIYGQLIDRTATPAQLNAALSGWAPDVRNRISTIHAEPYTHSGSQIVAALKDRWPLIVGLRNPNGGGHAYVLTGVYYSVDMYNNPVFHRVVLRDPWPGNPSRQEISWREFRSRMICLTRVFVQRH